LFSLNAEYATTLVLVTHNPELGGRCQRSLELHGGALGVAE
jgi:putative ABC transport system ATP-binding protein